MASAELAAAFPAHVVCEWLGNTEDIAREHYFRVTDDDFARATGRRAARGDDAQDGRRCKSAAVPFGRDQTEDASGFSIPQNLAGVVHVWHGESLPVVHYEAAGMTPRGLEPLLPP